MGIGHSDPKYIIVYNNPILMGNIFITYAYIFQLLLYNMLYLYIMRKYTLVSLFGHVVKAFLQHLSFPEFVIFKVLRNNFGIEFESSSPMYDCRRIFWHPLVIIYMGNGHGWL